MTRTLFRKSILLKDFDIHRNRNDIDLIKNVSVGYEQLDNKKDGQVSATIVGTKEEINNQLSLLSKRILSDRFRTLKNVPRCRIIGTKVERVQ